MIERKVGDPLLNKGNTDSIDVIHHFFGASLGLWLVYVLVENKFHANTFSYLFLIIFVLSVILLLLANAFKCALKEEIFYKRIVSIYTLPAGFTLIVVFFLLRIEDSFFKNHTPACQFKFLFLIVLFWIINFEAYHLLSYLARSKQESKRK